MASPTATSATLVVERRFNGPRDSANGGYACGWLTAFVDGPAEVTLRRPVPLDTPLDAERHDDGSVTLHASSPAPPRSGFSCAVDEKCG